MDEIITANETAALLKVHKRTVYRLAEQGIIPGSRIGHRWRFNKGNILALVSKSNDSAGIAKETSRADVPGLPE